MRFPKNRNFYYRSKEKSINLRSIENFNDALYSKVISNCLNYNELNMSDKYKVFTKQLKQEQKILTHLNKEEIKCYKRLRNAYLKANMFPEQEHELSHSEELLYGFIDWESSTTNARIINMFAVLDSCVDTELRENMNANVFEYIDKKFKKSEKVLTKKRDYEVI